jgi:hypothetical protein
MTSLIAMQKVEGSNPFSRFTRKLALERAFVVQAGHSGNQTTPAYRLHFRH